MAFFTIFFPLSASISLSSFRIRIKQGLPCGSPCVYRAQFCENMISFLSFIQV